MNYEFESDDDFQAKRGMGTGTKVLVALLVGLAMVLIACCGGCYYVVNYKLEGWVKNAFKQTMNPAEVEQVRESFLSMDIPEEFVAKSAVEMNIGYTMKMAMYSRAQAGSDTALILMYMNFPGAPSREEMEQQFEQQRGNVQQDRGNIQVTETEIVEIMIDGSEVQFEFAKGTDTNSNEIRYQVMGMFAGQVGMNMVMLIEDEEHWDREAVIRMLESIKTRQPPPGTVIQESNFDMDEQPAELPDVEVQELSPEDSSQTGTVEEGSTTSETDNSDEATERSASDDD